MTLTRENLANAFAFIVGFSLLPITYVWCGGNIVNVPLSAVALVGIPLGFGFAAITHNFYSRE